MLIHAYIQWWHEILLMGLLVVAIGFSAFPLVSRIASSQRDRGYAMSKAAGLAMLTFFTWLFSHVLGYGIAAIILAFSTIALLSIVALKKKPELRIATIVEVDLVFAFSFLLFIAIQMYHPFIEGGPTTTLYTGERFMGSAFLNAINRASSLPPPDPWLSGYKLQHYYYFGYLMCSILTKLSAIPTTIAFNILTPLCAALTASITYGLGYNLTGKRRYGLLTAVLVVFIGNLHLFRMLLEQLATSPDLVVHYIAIQWDYYYWSSTRALFDTNQAITEFPFFSFMWGDVHPHTIGLAFQVLIISLLYAFICNPRRSIFGRDNAAAFFSVLLFAISLGFLYANSAWDYPGYAVLSMFVIGAKQRKNGASIVSAILSAGLPVAASVILYLPYILAFKAIGAKGIGIVSYPSPIPGFLLVHGLPLLAIAFFARSQKWTGLGLKRIGVLVLSSLFLVPLLVLLSILYPVLVFILPVIFFALLFLFREIREDTESQAYLLILCLILWGASIVFLTEIFYIMDYLAWGEYQRMNTVFKFYNQVWVLWMIAAAFCICSTLRRANKKLKTVFSVCLVILICASGIYPVLGTYTWLKGFETSPTLDGTAYLNDSSIRVDGASTEGDYAAICWISAMIKGSPVILEAVPSNAPWDQQFDYTYYSRVSSLTGLPTVVGWVFHESSWGYGTDITEPRIHDVNVIYRTEEVELALKKLRDYEVKYVFVGSLERAQYPESGLRKFEAEHAFKNVYDEAGTQIYEVRG